MRGFTFCFTEEFIFTKRVLFLCGVLSFTVTNLVVWGGGKLLLNAECKIQARLGSIRKLDESILCLKKKKKLLPTGNIKQAAAIYI